jgi:hypothetical protein
MSSELEYLKNKLEIAKSKIVNNDDGDLFCVTCGSELNLVEDKYNEEVYYCLECLEKSWRHDEMIVEGFEESPDVGD